MLSKNLLERMNIHQLEDEMELEEEAPVRLMHTSVEKLAKTFFKRRLLQ